MTACHQTKRQAAKLTKQNEKFFEQNKEKVDTSTCNNNFYDHIKKGP